jgi:hypothetical protein
MATTGRYNLIRINSVYLTSTGLSGGTPCKTSVEGLDALKSNYTGSTVIALDGTPINQVYKNNKRGLPLSITIETAEQAEFNSLSALLETALFSSSEISVYINGTLGTFLFSCLPSFPKPLEFPGDFQNTRIANIKLNFVIADDLYILAAEAGSISLTGANATLTQG